MRIKGKGLIKLFLVVFIGILLASLLFLNIDGYLKAILFGGGLLTIVGIIDDIYDIHPLIRLATGLLASLIVVGAGIGHSAISQAPNWTLQPCPWTEMLCPVPASRAGLWSRVRSPYGLLACPLCPCARARCGTPPRMTRRQCTPR